MADQRISQLPALPLAAIASGDLLAVVDVSASQTKKTTVSELVAAGVALVPSGTLNLGLFNQNSTTKLGTASIADDAITAAKLANDSSIAVQTTAPSGDNFEGRGFFNSSTGNLQVFNGTSYQQVVLGASGISDGSISAAKIASGTITTAQIVSSGLNTAAYADGSVSAAKIASGTITTAQIASGTILAGNIATGTITGTRLAANTVNYDRIQAVSSGDRLLGRSSATSGTIEEIVCTAAGRALLDDADATTQRATLGLGTLATANGTWTNGSSFAGTSTGTNTGDQTITLTGDVTGTGSGTFAATIASGVVSSGKIADGAVIAAKLGDNAVTADKLNDNSATVVGTAAPVASGAFIGQQHVNTNTGFEYTWTGSAWQRLSGVATLAFSGSTPLTFSPSYPDNFSATITVSSSAQSANTVWAGPTSGSGVAPTFRALVAGDLPLATSGTVGATRPGTGLSVTSGVLNHANSVSGATINGFTFDSQGHISAATGLTSLDIPALDASKVETGEFPTERFADNSVNGAKLADYSTAQIANTSPQAEYTGQLFFNPLERSFFMWDGNVWQPIGISVGGIIFAGTYNAANNTVATVTDQGDAIGLVVGSGLPAAADENNGFYVVVSSGGTGTSPAPGVVLAPPDLILSNGSSWTEIDLSTNAVGQTASAVAFVPSGTITATNTQDAVVQVLNQSNNTNSRFYGVGTDTAALPSFVWQNDTDTGMFRAAANTPAMAASGVEMFRLDFGNSQSAGGRRMLFAATTEISTSNGALYLNAASNTFLLTTITDTTASAANAFLTSGGRIQRSTSSIRYKTDVETANLEQSKEIVYGTRPVWYRSICEGDPKENSYWGFIAEEVAEIDPRLVHHNAEGAPDGVQYDRYVVHLVNVVQEQRAQIEALEARLSALEQQ